MTKEPAKIKVNGHVYYNTGMMAATTANESKKFDRVWKNLGKDILKPMKTLLDYKETHKGMVIIRSEIDPASKARIKRAWIKKA